MSRRRETNHFVIHCSATRANQDVDAKTIRAWHRARGWSDIGYHYVIRRDGRIEPGRALGAIGSHVAGRNSDTLGICLVGGLNNLTAAPEDNFTAAQYAALADLCRRLLVTFPRATILGHRDLSPDRDGDGKVEPHEWLKACPCFDARAWARANRLPAAP